MLCEACEKRSFLDPRTKLILLVTLPTFLWGGAGGDNMWPYLYIFPILPLILFWASGNFRALLSGLAIYVGTQFLCMEFSEYFRGGVYIMFYILSWVVTSIVPCALMGIYVISTTTASEFIAGMSKFHIPKIITIPLSVMFRFFPTVKEEVTSVNNAMKMRGIKFGGNNVAKMVEYRLVPIMMCSLRIGDELSAAALTRGLGAPVKRTNICQIGFRIQDVIILLICTSAYMVWIFCMFGIYFW